MDARILSALPVACHPPWRLSSFKTDRLADPQQGQHVVEHGQADWLGEVQVETGAGGRAPVLDGAVRRLRDDLHPVELTVAGSDSLAGSLTVPAGASPTPAAPLFVPVTAKAGAKPGLQTNA